MRPAIAGRKLRRCIGITRAYIHRALEYGFDSAFINVTLHYGKIQPDHELMKLVDSFIRMDGSAEYKEIAAAQVKEFAKD